MKFPVDAGDESCLKKNLWSLSCKPLCDSLLNHWPDLWSQSTSVSLLLLTHPGWTSLKEEEEETQCEWWLNGLTLDSCPVVTGSDLSSFYLQQGVVRGVEMMESFHSLRRMYLFLFTASSSTLTSLKENLVLGGLGFCSLTPPALSSSSSSFHGVDMAFPPPGPPSWTVLLNSARCQVQIYVPEPAVTWSHTEKGQERNETGTVLFYLYQCTLPINRWYVHKMCMK